MITVVVVEDQTLVREGIRSLLALADDIEVVGEAADGLEAMALIAATSPDVVLLDLRMPRMDGLTTLRALGPNPPAVLVLTTFDDDDAVIDAVRAGARGYLLKDVTLDQLVGAIRAVHDGGSAIHPGITETLLRRLAGRPGTFDRFDRPEPLTSREVEVLRLLTGGYSNREIAATLHLSEGTVKTTCPPCWRNSASETAPVPPFAASSWDTAPHRRPARTAARKGCRQRSSARG